MDRVYAPVSTIDWRALLNGVAVTITVVGFDFVLLDQFNAAYAPEVSASVGQPFPDNLAEPLRTALLSALEHTRASGETGILETSHASSAGSRGGPQPLWYRHEVKLLEMNGDTSVITVYSTDITAEKQQAQQIAHLRHIERRFRAIFDHASDGIIIAEARADAPDGIRQIEANQTNFDIVGYSLEEIQQLESDAIYPPDQLEAARGRLARNEYRKLAERRFQRKDGAFATVESMLVPVYDDSNNIVELITFVRDVTDRKRLEAELRLSEQRFRTLADTLPVFITWIDLDETYLYINPVAAAQMSFSAQEVIGRKLDDVMTDPEILKSLRERYSDVIQAGEIWQAEETYDYGGRTYQVLRTLVPQRDENGSVTGIISHSMDTTRMYEREVELRLARALAEQAIQVKDRFIANISHELRTPLNVILGFARLLGASDSLSEKSREYVNFIVNSGQHLTRLVNDLLDTSRIDLEQFQLSEAPLDLHLLVDILVRTQTERARAKGITFTASVHTAVPRWILGDETRLRQVISNLLENANKFTESGGFELRLTYTDTIAELKIEVLDTGEGIPDTLLGDIFEPFVTSAVSGKSSGIGLGLYITRSLVTRMGGRIWAENRPEGGSRFQVTLPLKTASGETPVAAGRSGAPVRVVRGQTDYRVMIVDDVSANALLLSEQLTTWGFSAETLTTGAALLARAREWQPHLILLDLYLPDIDGFTLARTLQQDGGLRDIPVIALTASTIPSDHERARALGCRAVLTKPINFDLLAGTIAMLFGLETVDASDPSLYSERQSRRSLQSLSHALRELPHAWLQQMYLAAATAVPEDARSRIAEIEDHYPTAAVTLRQWVDAYDLSQIADLIEQVMY